MIARATAIIRRVGWLFGPTVPALEVASAAASAGWLATIIRDPDFDALPSFRVLSIVPTFILISVFSAGLALAVLALRHPQAVTISRLFAGFICLSLAGTFLRAGAWPLAVTFSTLGAGHAAAAIHAEIMRQG